MSRFDAPTASVTSGALIGGAAIAGAIAASYQNYRQALLDRWAGLTITQLISMLDCSEAMRFGTINELNEARAENAALTRQLADRDYTFKLEQARRAVRARR